MIWFLWVFAILLQAVSGMLHYAMMDPVLLKQGTRAFAWAGLGAFGLGIVMQGLSLPSFRTLFKKRTGEDLPEVVDTVTPPTPLPPPPPKNASGGFIATTLLLGLAAIAWIMLCAVAFTGCTPDQQAKAKAELSQLGTYAAADCGPGAISDYNDVRNAIHSGGSSWFSVVADAFGCIEKIVTDELRSHGVMADAFETQRMMWAAEVAIGQSLLLDELQVRVGAKSRDWRGILTLAWMQLDDGDGVLEASNAPMTSPSPRVAGLLNPGELRRAHMAIAFERAALKIGVKFRGAK